MFRFSKSSYSLNFSNQIPVYMSLSPHTSHAPLFSFSFPPFDHPNNIRRGTQNKKLLISQSFHPPLTSSHLGTNKFLAILFPTTLIPCPSLNVRDQASHPYKTKTTFGVSLRCLFHTFSATLHICGRPLLSATSRDSTLSKSVVQQ
jgi:hypothetical protein